MRWSSYKPPRTWCDSDLPNPILYVHSPELMARVEFAPYKLGRFFVVANHDMEETVYYGSDRGEVPDDRIILKGKVLSYNNQSKGLHFITLQTALLDKGILGRKLRTRIASLYRRKLVCVRQVELDERTGRILIAADYPTTPEIRPFACRIYLANLTE